MTISAYAPGRVELLGNHTDYNEGVVIGVAIDLGLTVQGSQRDDGVVSLESASMGEVKVALSELRPVEQSSWANYQLGVVNELIKLKIPINGFSAFVSGDLPPGCGLSSSAALELATALFLLKLVGGDLPRLEIAKACQRAEHNFVGVQSGLLDQVTSLFGRADHVVFFDARTEEVRVLPFPPELALLIADSGRKRTLATGDYNRRRLETRAAADALDVAALRDVSSVTLARVRGLPDLLRRRATHIVQENERVWRALELLAAGDGAGFGALMNASHQSSQENFENSTPELDLLVSIAHELPGVLGARLTGGGFGGATVTLCQRYAAVNVAKELAERFARKRGTVPHVMVARIGAGAALVDGQPKAE